MKKIIYLLLLITLFSCSEMNSNSEEKQNAPKEQRLFPAALKAGFNAHGTIELWDKFNSLTFEFVKGEVIEKQQVDLKSRKVRITSPNYTIGFDGTDVWVMPDSASFDSNARFYHNLIFYFFGLPYLAADPGINYKDLGMVVVNGEEYKKVLFTFEENIGDSPEDQYVLYFNNENRLELINYSVTYFDNSRATKYNAIKYEDWESFDGILLPKTFIGYKWENDSLGDERYRRKFQNIQLSQDRFDDELFKKPSGAYVSPK